jgi:hypothetical protein
MDSEIAWTNIHSARAVIAAVIALWSCVIGPEFPGEWGGAGPVADPVPVAPLPRGSGGRIDQDRLGDRSPAAIDRDAFLASYRRQARQSLNACLQSWRPSPGQATFAGVLQKKTGRISNLEVLGEGDTLPGCVAELTGQMDFLAVAETMTAETILLQWNAEW